MPRPVALVSATEARHLDSDLDLLVRALGDRGVLADVVDWDADVDWSRYGVAVLRSTWDYHRRLPEFLAWVDRVSSLTTLHNPAEIVRWNVDKRYLSELAAAGIPIIPTQWVASEDDLAALGDDALAADIVVKPTVSAGANDTLRHRADAGAATAHIRALLAAGKTAMVQPYQRFIDERGETGMLYFDGRFSHAFRKAAILAGDIHDANGLYVEEKIGPRTASPEERELGDAVMGFVVSRFGAAPLYARVDVVRGSAGVPVLMELELVEPSLFLHVADQSAERAAAAIAARR